MAHCTTKTSSIKGKDKKSVNDEVKKTVTNKVSSKTAKTNQQKANLQRGKLPLNWNKFIDVEVQSQLSKSTIKKYPKSVIDELPQNAKIPVKIGENMGACKYSSPDKCVAIDCEMVGIGLDGRDNMLARVSLVDGNGSVVYDTFVKAQQHVVDYRTAVSGVRPTDMEGGREFRQVQDDVSVHIAGKLLIGHAIRNDLKVLYLSHPRKLIRDTSKYKKFREETAGRTPSLKHLSSSLLGMTIQHGEHSSVEDARATMLLYRKYRNEWEHELKRRHNKK